MNLEGINVLDLTRLLPGPFASQLLSDLGARVVKIEEPGRGDYARYFEPKGPDGHSLHFDSINRGKESLTLDLTSDRGQELFYRLAEDADVVFEQFRPGVAESLGVGYEDIRRVNDDIVYCSLSGFGQTGPDSDRVGHDLNYVGMAGLLDMTRDDRGEPVIPGYPIADMSSGVFAALSIVSALLSRELGTQEGNYLDVSMTDCALTFSHSVASLALAGHETRPGETLLTGKYPCYDIYPTEDGEHVTVAALEPKFWSTLCTELDCEHLIEKHRSEDEAVRQGVREELTEVFTSNTRAYWEEKLGATASMFGPVVSLDEITDNPQFQHRDLIRESDDGVPRIGFPAVVEHGRTGSDETVPELGEHTDRILAELGIDESDREQLHDDNVV